MDARCHGISRSIICVAAVFAAVMTVSTEGYTRPSFCRSVQDGNGSPKSFLWLLRGRQPPVYFFGTIHVPYTRVWGYIPENVKQAFQEAHSVFFELDLIDPYTIAALAKCQMLPSGESLADVLPEDVYQRLKKHLDYVRNVLPTWLSADQRGRGLYADYLFNAIAGNWERKRPVWVMLMVNSLTENDIKTRGIPVLDLYLAQEAHRMEKRSGAVERVEEQCVPLNGLNFTQVLFALNQTLVQQENLRSGDPYPGYTTDDLIKHYNCGNLDSVYLSRDAGQVPHLANASLRGHDGILARNIDQYFKNELVHKRNVRMGERVLELIQTYPDESFFFAFGAGHFLGNNTVLDYVTSQGYKVDQVPPDMKIPSTKRAAHHFRHRHRIHQSHRDGQPDANDDLQNFQNVRLSRRKYRKRQNHNHHHHGVQLLRTSTAASTRRTFNDLWIKMDDFSRPTTRHLPPVEGTDYADFEETLRAWYGQSSSAFRTQKPEHVTWIMCCFILVGSLRTR